MDICKKCRQKAQDWELLQMMEEDYIEKPKEPPDLTKQQQLQLDQLLEEYQDVIAKDDDPPGHINVVKHNIVTDDTLPIKQ